MYPPSGYDFQYNGAFNSIFGVNSDRLARYGTLELGIPEDCDIVEDLFRRLTKAFPRLTSLKILNLSDPPYGALLSLPSVETLVLEEGTSFKTFKVTPTTLRHLEIFIEDYPSELIELSSFKLLRTLKIHIFNDLPTEEPPISLHLPCLDQLFISGDYSVLQPVDFQLPSLDLLGIQVDDTEDISPLLPQVCPRRIELQIDTYNAYISLWQPRETETAIIREIFTLSGTTQSITFPDSVFSEMVEVLTSCLEDASVPSLNEVIILFKDGSKTSFDPHNGMELQSLIEKFSSFVTLM